MVKTKDEQIFIGIDDLVIELIGKEKDSFLAQRELDLAEEERNTLERQKEKALKFSAYTKLGLTTEEINAIL